MEDCIFCRIANGELNTEFLFKDEKVLAFADLYPQAPIHALIIPRSHFRTIKDIEDEQLIGHLFSAGRMVAKNLGLEEYRFVINTGEQAGQTVFHLHIHLLGGRQMNWPPG